MDATVILIGNSKLKNTRLWLNKEEFNVSFLYDLRDFFLTREFWFFWIIGVDEL